VVAVTSVAAAEAYEGWGAYGASKAALEHLARVLAEAKYFVSAALGG
jgi:NAD(P)-dependent dehydrogenase (short-subunit alcohol dehydrogenase family)